MQTFSIGFAEEAFNELPYARQVAERFGTRHIEEVVTPDARRAARRADALLRRAVRRLLGDPDVPGLPAGGRHVKVVLSGDGGDEAFGGYARYAHDLKEAALRRRLPGWFRRRCLGPLAGVWPKADWLPRPLRAKTLLTNSSLDAGAAYANTLTLCRPPLRRRLLRRPAPRSSTATTRSAIAPRRLRDRSGRRRPGRHDRRRRRRPCCRTTSWSRSTAPAWPTAWRSGRRCSITSCWSWRPDSVAT